MGYLIRCLAWGVCVAGVAAAQKAPHTPPVAAPEVAAGHPRLVFGAGRSMEQVRGLYRSDAFFRSTFDQALAACEKTGHPAMAAACWIVSGDDRHARTAARLMEEAKITESGSGSYSNIWSFALAWDWLYHHPELAGGRRERVAARIAERLSTELAQLDDTGMALWHGRNQAANGAMVAALALDGEAAQRGRATAHYIEALRALDFSEGWPEGPSYWIYNRALPYAVAADCYLTATGQETLAGLNVRAILRKIGLWTLYQYGPNGIFEPFGDSVGSLRLGETGMWEASADYFARLSRDPALAAGANFLRSRSPAPYGKRPIHWYAALAYEPAPRGGVENDSRPELILRRSLPQAMLFGRRSLGVAFFRGAWGDADELFASFKAGDLLAHHDHYNNGHFSIQQRGLLVPLTGVYGASSYTGAYRLGYAIQTVASNSLLVLSPGETSRALLAQPSSPWTALSGGQRVIRPAGFDCLSLEHFRRSLEAGPRLARAVITAFESVAGRGDYIAADITASYNSTRYAEPGAAAKVSMVTRQFLYLRDAPAFVVFDRVETTQPGFTPKFLLHSIAKPETAAERLLTGAGPDDGILETRDRAVTIRGEGSVLTQRVLLPERSRVLKIGGPNFAGYVEADGDQTQGFSGTNLTPDPGKGAGGPKPLGLWRVEVEPEPGAGGTSHRFLNVLLPGAGGASVQMLKNGDGIVAVRVGGSVAVFAREARPLSRVELELESEAECWIVDARPGAVYAMAGGTVTASIEGVLVVKRPRGRLVLEAK